MTARSCRHPGVNFRAVTVLAGLMAASCAPQVLGTPAGAGQQSERYIQVSQRPGISGGQPDGGDILQPISSCSATSDFTTGQDGSKVVVLELYRARCRWLATAIQSQPGLHLQD